MANFMIVKITLIVTVIVATATVTVSLLPNRHATELLARTNIPLTGYRSY